MRIIEFLLSVTFGLLSADIAVLIFTVDFYTTIMCILGAIVLFILFWFLFNWRKRILKDVQLPIGFK